MNCIIIGGGIVGCATARELSKFDIKITLLEKTADICNGQSKANTAIVHAGHDAIPGTLKAKFNVLGNGMFDEICGELDVPFKRNTSLVVSFDENDDSKLEELMERGKQNGVHQLSIINHDEILHREPNINIAATKALLAETGGIVCPYELTQAYAENAAINGVEFIRNAPVTEIIKVGEQWQITADEKTYSADVVINCAGLFADEINNMVSSDHFSTHPRRGEYYLIDKKYSNAFHAAIFQVPTKMGKGILVAKTVDGTILLGPTADDIEWNEDTRSTAAGLSKVMYGAKITWPTVPGRAIITTFSGNRAHCDRNDFIIGESPDAANFFNAAGIESPGLTSAPAIGRFLAESIARKYDLNKNVSFNPIRKGIPKFREMSNSEREEIIQKNPDYGKVVCRCEMVTEGEIREAIRRPVGARTMDGIKRRTRAGMGRCQAGFCTPRVMEILCEETGMKPTEVTKCGGESNLLTGYLFNEGKRD